MVNKAIWSQLNAHHTTSTSPQPQTSISKPGPADHLILICIIKDLLKTTQQQQTAKQPQQRKLFNSRILVLVFPAFPPAFSRVLLFRHPVTQEWVEQLVVKNNSMATRRVVIVGGVAGGAACAARLRRLDESCEIIMFERSPHVSFANVSSLFCDILLYEI